MDKRITKFVDVILPVSVPNLYTYRVPHDLTDVVVPGQRVIVEFGKRKRYSALIRKVHETAPSAYQAKYIENVLDELPIATEEQFKFWEWISEYYMCTIGEVQVAALPSALKLASETRIVLNLGFEFDYDSLTDKEFLITEALEIREVLSLLEISEILDQKTVYPLVKSLIDKRVVLIEEELKERYKPKIESYIKLTEEFENEETLKIAFDDLSRAPKQLELLMRYIEQSQRYSNASIEVKKTALQKITNSTSSQTNQLVKKGIFELYDKEIGRLERFDGAIEEVKALSEEQTEANKAITESFKSQQVCLLYGVTGSGKTEVYVKQMQDAIAKGGKVLYLLPEIALTTQIINRLRKYFGDRVGVYHSKFNANERVEIWNNVLTGQGYDIILGARSSLFLPFKNLDLIIVDEEHENSFKQYDPAPRYHARDASIMLAHLTGAKVILGSATPSIESFWNANQGRYGLAQLTKRYGGLQLPEVLVADVKEEHRKKKMSEHFSSFLLRKMHSALEKGEQIILFQNRRGYTPQWNCEDCGWVPNCTRCDVSLTYHKYQRKLSCHYCGYSIQPPKTCEGCGSHKLNMLGFGTEKIEEDLAKFLPKAKVARMDLDTTRSKHAYQNILGAFEQREVDVLVGTQMVTKGLDFDNVSLVGILNADQMLNFPDFRAFERSYQLMAQVSGRAGRKKKRGEVIIQTWNPNHWIIQKVMTNDYEGMYHQELLERRNFHYPPFYRLIQITVKHRDRGVCDQSAQYLVKLLQDQLGGWVLGPEAPSVSRIRNFYLMNILIKFDRKASPKKIKSFVSSCVLDIKKHKTYKSSIIRLDVDPI
ncbi:MAG: primosomal protein N' (replication factor Y) [Parvicellaceae bacterium]|jgi:primosomal protein N' (replication factor Y)